MTLDETNNEMLLIHALINHIAIFSEECFILQLHNIKNSK